jgi:CheY-like chemotaxis protein
VELHGGTVKAYSLGEGQGATFTVKLPLLQSSHESKESKNLDTHSHLVPSSLILAGLKILVVDDEPDIRELLIFMLEQYGAIVTAVASAEHALEVLAHTQQDLLLSDIGMPNVNGYTLMRQIRDREVGQYNRQIQAIALTGYARDLDIQQAKLAGFHKIIVKPVERTELVTTILSLTGRSDK